VRTGQPAAAALAVAAPLILAGLPGQAPRAPFPSGASPASRPAHADGDDDWSWPALQLSVAAGPGAPRAGQSYRYLVSIRNPDSRWAWLVQLALSLPPAAEVTAVAGAGDSCRTGPAGLGCRWTYLPGHTLLAVSVTVSLGPQVTAGTTLTAAARLGWDWGKVACATSVQAVAPPPSPHRPPSPPPAPSAPPAPVTPNPPPPASTPPAAIRPAPATSLPPRPRSSRSPSPAAIFRGDAAKLFAPAPARPVPGLPLGLLLAVILAPCVAAAVTRFARRR